MAIELYLIGVIHCANPKCGREVASERMPASDPVTSRMQSPEAHDAAVEAANAAEYEPLAEGVFVCPACARVLSAVRCPVAVLTESDPGDAVLEASGIVSKDGQITAQPYKLFCAKAECEEEITCYVPARLDAMATHVAALTEATSQHGWSIDKEMDWLVCPKHVQWHKTEE